MARDTAEPAPAADEWPPHPDAIDLHARDSAGRKLWLTPGEAAYEAQCSERVIWRRIATEPISYRISRRTWVYRRRLMAPSA